MTANTERVASGSCHCFQLAEEIGNVAKACQIMGSHRATGVTPARFPHLKCLFSRLAERPNNGIGERAGSNGGRGCDRKDFHLSGLLHPPSYPGVSSRSPRDGLPTNEESRTIQR